MKKFLIVFLAFGLSAGYSCQAPADPEGEKEAIKAVIIAEQEAYFEQDIDKITGTWKQDTSSRKILSGKEGYWEIHGWTELYNENKENLKEDRPDLSGIDLKNSDFDIILYDNTALVYHDAIWSGMYEGKEYYGVQKRILHMVKVDEEWKIDLMYMYGFPEEVEAEEDILEQEDL